ncbi:hypothetical protein ASPZODRAFT_126592 [Penicilliopsis zonata CBS 506.65]|uniref:Sodium/calcium exchanger membrane region domain-containing protein n=1 Tax=Penicilliopsis zonata CBS 506.65 TaxID=1073090 RepID=A0A1L9SU73_9EURO|nr:hypothetical protein ASPZODRAFT_126592 [Penicilliopsis zonata CBS 506.65]OJJ50671.1 hypothetical protein ASPZODRAFT_126592 [Penicilliopsis zonata CBS 506.65]
MHRIHSWAKAHASSNSVATDGPSKRPVAQLPEEPAPAQHDAQVKEKSRDPAPQSGSDTTQKEQQEQGLGTRMRNGCVRFLEHTKDALFHSWVNVLLVFVPVGIAAEAVGLSPAIIFAMNAIAIIPLAGLLSHATECVASRLGDTVGALINVTFGNAVELIIFIIALVKDEIRIVQASLLGSILANLLLILGMAFLLGGLRFREQIYNSTVTQMSACLLSLSVTSLLLPTAFHASWADDTNANKYTLKVSRGTSVVLLLVYILYILFQLKSHSYLYASIPKQIIDEESHPGVLADFMNSSSDSSTSSDDDTDDSSTSWTTAKRIKRAMKYRRHRKSSTSSKGTSSRQSVRKKSIAAISAGGSAASNADVAASCAIVDEARYDADDDGPRTRDFGQELAPVQSNKSDRKAKKHSKKSNKRRAAARAEDQNTAASQDQPQRPPLLSYQSEPSVEHRAAGDDQAAGAANEVPKKLPSFRPTFPSLLSNTVFSAQSTDPRVSQAYPQGIPGVRRASSLPPRMNRQPGIGNAVQFARTAARMPRTADSVALEPDAEEIVEPEMSRTAAVVLLLVSTALVAVCAEFLVDNIPAMIASSNVSQTFIGLIILPIVGNAAEHVTAVSVAAKNKMDLAIGVSVGSSIQIAIFVTPFVVLLGWFMDKDMSLYFTLFETICLFVTAFVVNFLVLDGRSNYLEGALLIAAYVIIAVGAFYYPSTSDASSFAS